jgi:Alpha/beta hydrolase domain
MGPVKPATSMRFVVLVIALTTSLAAIAPPAAATNASAVSGPIDGDAFLAWNDPGDELRDWPTALADYGYVEDEFFIAGQATAYSPVGAWQPDGRWEAEPSGNDRFVTRLLVRRPADPASFNGIVVVEWLNTSFGYDFDAMFRHDQTELLRKGYVWVGVSAQSSGVNALKQRDPARYGQLRHPGDAYSFDIFSRAARAAADPKSRVLGALHPEWTLATGVSQSAGWLVTYVNAVHPLVHVIDGYLLRSAVPATPLVPGGAMPLQSRLRPDAGVPVISVQTETDIIVFKSHLRRQPDTAKFRLWEVAGSAHLDVGPPHPDGVPATSCTEQRNVAPLFAVTDAALAVLAQWVRGEGAPAHAERLEIGEPGAADPLIRDRYGDARGGIRLPELDVPRATLDGVPALPGPDAPPGSGLACQFAGRTIPFSDTLLDELYPTTADYLTAFNDAVRRAVRAKFLLPEDGKQMIEAEARTQRRLGRSPRRSGSSYAVPDVWHVTGHGGLT